MTYISNFHTIPEMSVGQRAKVIGFDPGRKAYRQKLLAMGLTPGVVIELQRVAPLGDPLEIKLRGYSLSLRKNECDFVMVELL